MGLSDFIDDTARSVAFLSRIPVPDRYFDGHYGRLSRAVQAFPAAGLIVSLPAAITLFVCVALKADPLFSAFVALAIQTVITGALHDDGLSDSADGLVGGRDREKALMIMKDSRIGSYGAVAMILSFGLRASALAAILPTLSALSSALVFLAVTVLARAALVWHWTLMPPARKDGVAASVGEPEPFAASVAYATAAAFAIVALLAAMSLTGLVATVVAIIALVYGFSSYVRHKIDGHTGDTLGASLLLAEIAGFSALALLG